MKNIFNHIYVINLDRSKDRLMKITENLNKYNLSFNRFSAIDGSKLSDEQISQHTTKLCRSITCNKSIIGCALSHILLWTMLINDDNADYYLILEDDIIINDDFIPVIGKLMPRLYKNNIEYVNLHCGGVACNINENMFIIDKYKFGKSKFPLCASGNIVSKEGAKKLLKTVYPIYYHIDYSIALQDINHIIVYPPLVKTQYEESTLSSQTLCIFPNVIRKLHIEYIEWLMNLSIFTINLKFPISVYFIILMSLLIINIVWINSSILMLILLIEIMLYLRTYI